MERGEIDVGRALQIENPGIAQNTGNVLWYVVNREALIEGIPATRKAVLARRDADSVGLEHSGHDGVQIRF